MPLPKGSNPLLSNSFFIFIIRFFPSLANLMVMIWYSRQLLPTVYGDYQHFWIQMAVFAPIACFGIHVVIITYTRDMLANLASRINSRHCALYGLWVLLMGVVFALLQYHSINLPFLIPLLFVISISLSTILESALIVFKDHISLTIISILYSVLFWSIHWYVLQHGFSLSLLFTCLLALSLCRFAAFGVLSIINRRRFIPESTVESFTPAAVRSLWLHLGFYDILQVLFNYVDKFIISLVLTAGFSAVYYNGSQNIPFLPLLLSAAGNAVLMQLASGNKQSETADTIRLMNQSGRLLSCIVFPSFFFLFFFRSEFILTLFSEKYRAAIPVFAVSILALPIRAYSFTTVLQRAHRGAIINAGAIADLLLACALMYPLYLWLGLPGVALSFVISTYLQAAFYLVYSARILNISPLQLIPYGNWLIKLIVFAAIFIVIHYSANLFFPGKITLILGGLVMSVVMAVSLLLEFRKQKQNGATQQQATAAKYR